MAAQEFLLGNIRGPAGPPGQGGFSLGYTPQGFDWEYTGGYYLGREVWAIRLQELAQADLENLNTVGSGSIWHYETTLVSVPQSDEMNMPAAGIGRLWVQSDLKLFLPDSYYTMYSGDSFQIVNLPLGHSQVPIGERSKMDVTLNLLAPTQRYAGYLQLGMSILNPLLNGEDFEQKYLDIFIDGVLYSLQ